MNIEENCFFLQNFRDWNSKTKMPCKIYINDKKFWLNAIIAYSVIIIIIQSVYIANSGNSQEYKPGNATEPTTNSTIIGCNIKDIGELKGLSIGCLVLAITLVLLSMCIQSLKPDDPCGANDTECRSLPYYGIFMSYCVMQMLCGVMFSRGDDFDDNPVFKPIYKFETSGCDTTQINSLYASIFITCLPGLIIGTILGIFLIGWFLYGIVYVSGNWFTGCIKDCQSEQTQPKHSEPSTARAKPAKQPSRTQNREALVAILIDDQLPIRRSVSHSSLPPEYTSGDSGSMPPSYSIAARVTTVTTKESYA